ncbi:hypothetical protein Cni_G28457 [Canna indica]|uniref:Uncharacterized protein n=1 Tax=Canna indica TaxID=4628 RepID=A0AAQ3L3X0_9LILI|nr:hypothetical protein Cni_G28457 [Canna indica]
MWAFSDPNVGARDLSKYMLRLGDFVHASLVLLVFATLALLDNNTEHQQLVSFPSSGDTNVGTSLGFSNTLTDLEAEETWPPLSWSSLEKADQHWMVGSYAGRRMRGNKLLVNIQLVKALTRLEKAQPQLLLRTPCTVAEEIDFATDNMLLESPSLSGAAESQYT